MKFYLTDVFGKSAYSGNQLATFTGCTGLSDAEMQKIAREINFSETTFVLTDNPDATEFKVRIFTISLPITGNLHISLRLHSQDKIAGAL